MDVADPPELELILYNQNDVERYLAKIDGKAYTRIFKKKQQNSASKQEPFDRVTIMKKPQVPVKPESFHCAECSKEVNCADLPFLRFHSKAAEMYGLDTSEQLCRLEKFLYTNGNYGLIHTRKNGACMFDAFRKCINCPLGYTNTHLRRQIVMELAKNREFFLTYLKEHILEEYGKSEKDIPGPFSYQSYLQYMLERDSWGDQSMLLAMSAIFKVRITVVGGESLGETKFRHSGSLRKADVVLVFCGGNHYVAAVKPHSKGGNDVLAVQEVYIKDYSYNIMDEDPSVYSDEEDADFKSVAMAGNNCPSTGKETSDSGKISSCDSDTVPNTVNDSAPEKDKVPKVEDSVIPMDSSTPEVDSSVTPMDNSSPDVEIIDIPMDNSSPDVEIIDIPMDNSTPEVESSVTPMDNSTPEVESSVTCEDNAVLHVGNSSTLEDSAAPVLQGVTTLTQFPAVLIHFCDDCQKAFTTKWSLMHHRATKHEEGKFYYCSSPTCMKKFPSKGKLNAHAFTHLTASERINAGLCCKHCHKLFTAKRNLKTHIKKCHTLLATTSCWD